MTQQIKLCDSSEACVLSYKNPHHVWGGTLVLLDGDKSAPQEDPHPAQPPCLAQEAPVTGPSLQAVLRVPFHLHPQLLPSLARISGDHRAS